MDQTDHRKLPILIRIKQRSQVSRLTCAFVQFEAKRHVFQKSVYSDGRIFVDHRSLLWNMHGYHISRRNAVKHKRDSQQAESARPIYNSTCSTFRHHLPASASLPGLCVESKFLWVRVPSPQQPAQFLCKLYSIQLSESLLQEIQFSPQE